MAVSWRIFQRNRLSVEILRPETKILLPHSPN
ncbi:hypothetical protein AVEN_164067-1, partial [Araneus ventricosus]